MTATQITPDLVKQHGLKPDEYERFVALISRTPTMTWRRPVADRKLAVRIFARKAA